MSEKIFIQIASYRDPELLPTIKDCIHNASQPENLVFGIAWQHDKQDKWDHLEPYKNDPRFRILDLDYKESRGACWARNQIQKLYNNEKYTLQLDSHHRFTNGWDKILKYVYNQCIEDGHKKPLLTGYPPSYYPEKDPIGRVNGVLKTIFHDFDNDGNLLCRPVAFDSHSPRPILSRFFAGGFSFTSGNFIKEVPYDPNLYFLGEEISMAVRAFTHGYDLLHPHVCVLWHEYTREKKSKHWSDHPEWHSIQNESKSLLDYLFNNEPTTDEYEYGFGKVRTVQDYTIYSGISIKDQSVQQYTKDGHVPPNPLSGTFDKKTRRIEKKYEFKNKILVDRDFFNTEYDFCAVIYEDRNGVSLHREDIPKFIIDHLVKTPENEKIPFWSQFDTVSDPIKYTVWLFSYEKGWLNKIVKKLDF